MKRNIIAIVVAWLLFLGVDFLFHASLFASLWKDDVAAFKSTENLFLLIPAGYGSFLLLTILIWYLFFRIFKTKPEKNEVVKFGIIFGLLFSVSNMLGMFSYVAIPLKHLLLFHLVYFIELIVVTLSLYYIQFSTRLKKAILRSLLIFFILLITGIAIQNII